MVEIDAEKGKDLQKEHESRRQSIPVDVGMVSTAAKFIQLCPISCIKHSD
jgi:hypothetical protein